MTCETCARLLDDFVDGTLAPEMREDVLRHLGACGDCRSLADDLGAIRSLARELPRLAPPGHVWEAVAARTYRPSARNPLAAFLTIWRPALAAATSVVLVIGLAWVGGRLTDATTRMAAERDAAVPGRGSVYPAESSYTHAIARLEALAQARRSELQPAIAEVFDSGMVVIDTAIDQSRAALQTMPESDVARQSLLQALRTKVTLLQDALALAADPAAQERDPAPTAPTETTP